MGMFSGIRKVAGRVVDVRADKWMSFHFIRDSFDKTAGVVADLVIPKQAERQETFEDALRRLNLTEDDIKARQSEFTRLVAIFMILGVSIIGYAIYMVIHKNYAAGLISICLSLYAFSQAFRFHFWLFQMKNRKLGCTIQEWLNSKVSLEQEESKAKKDEDNPSSKQEK